MTSEADAQALALAGLLDGGGLTAPSDAALQRLLASAVAAYARRVQEATTGGRTVPRPFPEPAGVTATELVLACRQMLAALAIAPFELAILPG